MVDGNSFALQQQMNPPIAITFPFGSQEPNPVANWRIGLFVGSSFMFTSFLVSQPGHPQLQFAFFLPAVLLSCFSYLQQPSIPRALSAGAYVVGAFLSSVYYALFAVMIVGVFFIGAALSQGRNSLGSIFRFFAVEQ